MRLQKQIPEVLYKKVVLKNFANSVKSTCLGVFFNKDLHLRSAKETLTQVHVVNF